MDSLLGAGMMLRLVNVFVCLPPRFGFGLFGFALAVAALSLARSCCVFWLSLSCCFAVLALLHSLPLFFSFFPSRLPRQASFSPQGAKRGC